MSTTHNAEPDGLHRRDDITDVALWRIPDGDVLDHGALITVDLANGIRLATLHQDIEDSPTATGAASAPSCPPPATSPARCARWGPPTKAVNPHDRAKPEVSR